MDPADFNAHIDSLELVTQVLLAGIHELRSVEVNGRLDHIHFLRGLLSDAVAVSDVLNNASTPINRMPPEILTHIFSYLRTEVPIPAQFPARWPFTHYGVDTLHPVLDVCRRWRDAANAAPMLWNNITVTQSSQDHLIRCFGVPLVVCVSPGYSPVDLYDWCQLVEGSIRELHIDEMRDEPQTLLSFLMSFPASRLEHCKIEVLTLPFAQYRDSLLLPLFAGGGEKLRSLYLSSVPFLPTNVFPALTRFALVNAACHQNPHASWELKDLVHFLRGSPLLEELYMCRASIGKRAPAIITAKHPTVKLDRLRYFAIDANGEDSAVAVIRTLMRVIVSSAHCHRFFTPLYVLDADGLGVLLSVLPGKKDFTHLRIDFTQRNMLQLAGSLDGGSVSCSGLVASRDWEHLLVTFASSEWFANIEEVWVALEQYHWYDMRTLPSLFSCFPGLKRLALTHPAPLSVRRRSFDFLDTVLAPLIAPAPAAEGGGVMCPLLETVCVDLPAHVQDCKPLQELLGSRAEAQEPRPIRRLVVGYDPEIEVDLLAEVIALEGLVEELVVGEMKMPASHSSEWVLGIRRAFAPPISMYAEWPTWAEKAESGLRTDID